MSALILHVRLHDGRYHGEGDWPPSPARLFQALVAGAALGGPLADHEKAALVWLESQDAPIIAAPRARRRRQRVRLFMPNNDSDRIGGDPQKMAKIRTATKLFRPYFFDAEDPFLYAWKLAARPGEEDFARAICSLAERLYQLGRGLDMAWAWGEVVDDDRLNERLIAHPGHVFRPSAGKSAITLPAPCRGSFESLERRHRAYGERFRCVPRQRAVKVVFRQPPRPRFRWTAYESPPSRVLYELRDPVREMDFAPWPLTRVSVLVVRLRDSAVERLKRALPACSDEIDRAMVGRRPDGRNDGPAQDRIRILPLPSIGHVHADREIRRVLIEVPPTSPLRAGDVHWAFSGLEVIDDATGEILAILTRADDAGFLRHYGLESEPEHRLWRTVTPAALPRDAKWQQMDAACNEMRAKAGRERSWEFARVAARVSQALRHAGANAGVAAVRLQREPFEGQGARAETFATGTRFATERLWHVEIAFEDPVSGPLAIGDGRFLGLGIMAPIPTTMGIHVLAIEEGLIGGGEPEHIARALRRAVMARAQEVLGDKPLPAFFSGHDFGGGPARTEQSSHLAFACDLARSRLVVVAPHMLDRRDPTAEESRHLAVLDEALQSLRELFAGPSGRLTLRRTWLDVHRDPLVAPSRTWDSVTTYVVTRHEHIDNAREALAANLAAECRRRGLPEPAVEPVNVQGLAGRGLGGRARLVFPIATSGPLLLGRNRYMGGGLFVGLDRHS